MKLAALDVDSRVVIRVRALLVGHTRRVRVGGQLCKKVKVTSGVPQDSILGPLLFLVYVNDIWRNNDSTITLFGGKCVIYRKIANKNDIEKLQKNLDTLGERAVENRMKINPGKSKAIRFTNDQVKNQLCYSLCDQKIQKRAVGNNLTKQFKMGGPSK
jgi:hypothetical protein